MLDPWCRRTADFDMAVSSSVQRAGWYGEEMALCSASRVLGGHSSGPGFKESLLDETLSDRGVVCV